jgi:hypothetical protein
MKKTQELFIITIKNSGFLKLFSKSGDFSSLRSDLDPDPVFFRGRIRIRPISMEIFVFDYNYDLILKVKERIILHPNPGTGSGMKKMFRSGSELS